MAGARIIVDAHAARAALAALLQRLGDPAPALREIGEALLKSTDERFRRAQAPDGSPWAQNSDTTLLRYLLRDTKSFTKRGRLSARGARRIGAKKILRDSGDLQDTLRYQLTDGGRGLELGSNRDYAAMQQFGGTRAAFPHLWGDIPARPFLGLSDDDEQAILGILSRYLDG